MLLGFTDHALEVAVAPGAWVTGSSNLSVPALEHSYYGHWLGRSCGAGWSPTPVQNKWGILAIPGKHTVPPSGIGEEQTEVVMTKNGPITINSIISYVP